MYKKFLHSILEKEAEDERLRIEEEKKKAEDEKKRIALDEIARKQKEREKEIEEKMKRQQVPPKEDGSRGLFYFIEQCIVHIVVYRCVSRNLYVTYL